MNNVREQSRNPTKMRLTTTKKIKATMWKRRKKFQNSRLKGYWLPSTDSKKKANQETATESVPKTSKHATKKRRNGDTDLQRSAKTKRLHTRGVAKNKDKSDTQKKVTLKMLETTTRSALCLRCTRCFSLLDQAGFRRTYQAMGHLMTYRMIEQRCHDRGVKMWGRRLVPSPTTQFGTPSNPVVSSLSTSTS